MNKLVKRWCVAWNSKTVPPKYVAAIVDLEDFHTKSYGNLEYRKGLSKTNLKSLNGMQQKLKKNNSQYVPEIKQFRYVSFKNEDFTRELFLIIDCSLSTRN